MIESSSRQTTMGRAWHLFVGEVDPRRVRLAAIMFVLAAALLATRLPAVRAVGGGLWLGGALLAVRGWIRLMRARRDGGARRYTL